MSKTPVVLVDCDGVLADFVAGNVDELAKHGIRRLPEKVTEWDMVSAWGLDANGKKLLTEAWRRPGFCRSLKAYPGAREGVDALRRFANVYAVTAPMHSSPTWQWERVEWLRDEMGFDRDEIVSTPAKHLVCGDLLIDDKPETLIKWREDAWFSGQGILWARPYNRHSQWEGPRLSDWSLVVEQLGREVVLGGVP